MILVFFPNFSSRSPEGKISHYTSDRAFGHQSPPKITLELKVGVPHSHQSPSFSPTDSVGSSPLPGREPIAFFPVLPTLPLAMTVSASPSLSSHYSIHSLQSVQSFQSQQHYIRPTQHGVASVITVPMEQIPSTEMERVVENLPKKESFFHTDQQSSRILENYRRRIRDAFDMKRRAEIEINYNEEHLPKAMPKITPDPCHITLCMEIYSGQHKELFCKEVLQGPDSIYQISRDTSTIICFPDTEDKVEEYANQITITGHFVNVEIARHRLRDFSIMWIIFPVVNMKINLNYTGLLRFIEGKINAGLLNGSEVKFDVHHPGEVAFLSADVPALRVNSRLSNTQILMMVCDKLLGMLFEENNMPQCHALVEFPRHMRDAFVESERVLTESVRKNTGTLLNILVPEDPSKCVALHVAGQLKNVIAARGIITGLLPIYLVFDAADTDFRLPVPAADEECYTLDFTDDRLNVSARMTLSQMESSIRLEEDVPLRVIEMRTNEMNLANLYKAYILTLKESEKIGNQRPVVQTPEYEISKTAYRQELSIFSKNIMRGCRAAPLHGLSLPSSELNLTAPQISYTSLINNSNIQSWSFEKSRSGSKDRSGSVGTGNGTYSDAASSNPAMDFNATISSIVSVSAQSTVQHLQQRSQEPMIIRLNTSVPVFGTSPPGGNVNDMVDYARRLHADGYANARVNQHGHNQAIHYNQVSQDRLSPPLRRGNGNNGFDSRQSLNRHNLNNSGSSASNASNYSRRPRHNGSFGGRNENSNGNGNGNGAANENGVWYGSEQTNHRRSFNSMGPRRYIRHDSGDRYHGQRNGGFGNSGNLNGIGNGNGNLPGSGQAHRNAFSHHNQHQQLNSAAQQGNCGGFSGIPLQQSVNSRRILSNSNVENVPQGVQLQRQQTLYNQNVPNQMPIPQVSQAQTNSHSHFSPPAKNCLQLKSSQPSVGVQHLQLNTEHRNKSSTASLDLQNAHQQPNSSVSGRITPMQLIALAADEPQPSVRDMGIMIELKKNTEKENMPVHGDPAADHVAKPQSTGGVADPLNEFGNIAT
ncbi:hypothetical protein WR25_14631 [Diploscapter pachys]|uniref:Defective in germ line development protein 3-like KH5 domain-containing protein n=1 Tax=Diploscapter pachys TaxID=2018661 RepID=A0A2A2LF13_9BILA|nr:hypothetical protein WR25_14631 [Diploscapter pachys]